MSIDPLSVSPNQVDSDAMRTKINELISDNSSVTVGDTPPASPGEGDLWFDEGVASMYVYVAAPTNAWIQANPASSSGAASGGGGGLIDTHDIEVHSGGAQSHTIPNYVVGQRLYILQPGGSLNGTGARMKLIPAGPASSYPGVLAGSPFIYIWANSDTGVVSWWHASGEGSSYYTIMRYSA